jgi:hypothetical protein
MAELATDVVAIVGDDLLGVSIAEMGDGSGRSFALVSTLDRVNDLEQEFRIASPVAPDAPAWARSFDRWTIEVRTGDRWLELELELDDAGRIATAPELEAIAGDEAGARALADAVETPVHPDYVNHAALRAMSENELAGTLNEGGPSELMDAVEAELERRRESSSSELAYEIASSDVVLPLSRSDAEAIAAALELLAGVDEGEHTDYDELVRLAGVVRARIGARS